MFIEKVWMINNEVGSLKIEKTQFLDISRISCGLSKLKTLVTYNTTYNHHFQVVHFLYVNMYQICKTWWKIEIGLLMIIVSTTLCKELEMHISSTLCLVGVYSRYRTKRLLILYQHHQNLHKMWEFSFMSMPMSNELSFTPHL